MELISLSQERPVELGVSAQRPHLGSVRVIFGAGVNLSLLPVPQGSCSQTGLTCSLCKCERFFKKTFIETGISCSLLETPGQAAVQTLRHVLIINIDISTCLREHRTIDCVNATKRHAHVVLWIWPNVLLYYRAVKSAGYNLLIIQLPVIRQCFLSPLQPQLRTWARVSQSGLH